jgi:hypothetical protein
MSNWAWRPQPRHLVLTLVLALVLLVLGVYLSRHLERYSETVDKGADPTVVANPYLAAQSFLRQRGLRVDQATRLDILPRLPAATTSLLLLGDRSRMTPRQVEQILSWVRQGGRLLFVAEAIWDNHKGRSDDLLLDRLQLRQYETRTLPPAEPTDDPYPRLTKLYLDNEEAPAYFSFNPAFHLEDPTDISRSWANSSDSTHLMQLDYGAGLITVVTDADLWRNSALTRYDNAWLLWYLNQNRDVALIYQTEHDTLASQLWRYFPQALTLLLVWLLLFAWYSGARHGPVRQPAPLARRQLREYLHASAEFMLRHGGHQRLLRSLQHDILRRARQRHPGFERLPIAEQWHALARLTGETPSAVGQALRPRPAQKMSQSEFTRHVGDLQRIRNAL